MKKYKGYDLVNRLAKGITGYSFRNGIVEDFHADGCLSNDQMKQLNKYMVDRMGYVLYLLFENKVTDLDILLGFHIITTSDWDNVDLSIGQKELDDLK